MPLAVHLAAVGLTVAAGGTAGPLTFSSVTTFLLVFAVRLVNPTDGPLGEEPGWRGFALPGLSVEGSIQAQGWSYPGVWCTVALVLLVADRTAWRRPMPVTQDALILEGSR